MDTKQINESSERGYKLTPYRPAPQFCAGAPGDPVHLRSIFDAKVFLQEGNYPVSARVPTAKAAILKFLDEIITGCISNNAKDQKVFYERYYAYCLKIVFRYIYRYDKAVDTVNDGYVKIFRKIHTFHCDQSSKIEFMMMGWMKAIMINTAIDRLRRDDFLPEIGLTNENTGIEDRSSASDQALLYEDVIREIKKLPPAYRVVFNMYIIDGFTHQEIADQLNIAVGTSKSNLSKARVLLQSFIKKADEAKKCCM